VRASAARGLAAARCAEAFKNDAGVIRRAAGYGRTERIAPLTPSWNCLRVAVWPRGNHSPTRLPDVLEIFGWTGPQLVWGAGVRNFLNWRRSNMLAKLGHSLDCKCVSRAPWIKDRRRKDSARQRNQATQGGGRRHIELPLEGMPLLQIWRRESPTTRSARPSRNPSQTRK